MLNRALSAAALLTLTASAASAALVGPGDIAFTGFNSDGQDDLAFVVLKDVAPNTVFYLTDNEFDGTIFNTGESYTSYTAPVTGLLAGTVVTINNFSDATAAPFVTSLGTTARVTVASNANRGLSATADAVYAYLASAATPDVPTAFLSYVANDDVTSTGGATLTNTGLVVGQTALLFDGSNDGFVYNGARTGQSSFAAYLPLINNTDNQTIADDGTTLLPFSPTPFTVVPEPTSLSLLGLGGLALLRRKRA